MQVMNLKRIVEEVKHSDGNRELLFVEKILSQHSKAKKYLVDLIVMQG